MKEREREKQKQAKWPIFFFPDVLIFLLSIVEYIDGVKLPLEKKGLTVQVLQLRGHFTSKKIRGANVSHEPNFKGKIVLFP